MEHIGRILGRLDRATHTPTRTIPLPPELSPDELGRKREQLRQSLRLSSLDHTFETFKRLKGTEEAYKHFKALAEGKTDWKMLLCYGGVGNGKTHLCEASAITLYHRGIFARVLTMSRIMNFLKDSMKPESGYRPYSDCLESLCSMSHLIMDDVGMGGSGSSWEWGQLEDIVATRYRERLFTILTTNMDISEMPDRIISRFADPAVGRRVLNSASDFRTRKA